MKFASEADYASLEEVKKAYPNAVIIPVDGGWGVFESYAEFETWEKQT